MAKLGKKAQQAIRAGKRDDFIACLDGGVDVETRTNGKGDTLLLLAVRHGEAQMAAELLSRGADVHAKNNKGHGVLDAVKACALSSGRKALKSLLKTALDGVLPEEDSARSLEVIFNRTVGGNHVREVYLFADQERFTFVHDGKKKNVQAVCREGFDAIVNSKGLAEAFDEHRKRGGKMTLSDVIFPQRFSFRP